MQRLLPVLLLFLVGGAVYSVLDRHAAVASDYGALRVVTFNIHKGADAGNRYDLQRTIEAIASLDADIVGAQEVMRNDPQLNCDDQPARIAEGLRRATGERWAYAFAKSWMTTNRDCVARGRGDDVAMETVAIFTRERLVATEQIRLPESRVGLMARIGSMPDVPVVVTHLAAGRRNQPQRVSQLDMLLGWAAQYGAGVLMGDLNARPDAVELMPVLARYRDSWFEAHQRGVIRGVMSGGTRPGLDAQARVDYVFYASDAPLTLQSVDVIDTSRRPAFGDVSDHHPVAATFRRRLLTGAAQQ